MRRDFLLLLPPVLVAVAFTWWAARGLQHEDTIRAEGEALTGRVVSIGAIPRTSASRVEFELPNGDHGTTRVDQDIAARYAAGLPIDLHRLGSEVVADDSLDADTWFGQALAVDLFVALGAILVLLPSRPSSPEKGSIDADPLRKRRYRRPQRR